MARRGGFPTQAHFFWVPPSSIERAEPLPRRPAAPTPRPRQFAFFDSALCPAPVSQENEFRGGPRGSRFVRSAGFVRSGRRRFVAGRRSASRDAAAPRCARRGSSADETHHSPTSFSFRPPGKRRGRSTPPAGRNQIRPADGSSVRSVFPFRVHSGFHQERKRSANQRRQATRLPARK